MNRIRALRQEANVKQEELAKYLKVSRSSLSGYETGNFEAPVQIYFQLADYFGVTLDYLLGRTDIKNPAPVIAGGNDSLTEMETDLLNEFRQLNLDGQKIAVNTVRGFVLTGAYKKASVSGQIQKEIG